MCSEKEGILGHSKFNLIAQIMDMLKWYVSGR